MLAISSSSSSSSSSCSSASVSSSVSLSTSSKTLEPKLKLLGGMNDYSIIRAIEAGNADQIYECGSVLKYLPAEKISEYLLLDFDFPEGGPFDNLYNKNLSAFQSVAVTYMNIFMELMQDLPREVTAPIVYYFLLEQSDMVIEIAVRHGFSEVINKFAELWEKADELHLHEFYVSDNGYSLNKEKIRMMEFLGLRLPLAVCIEDGHAETVRAFGTMLSALRLSDNEEALGYWARGIDDEDETTEIETLIQTINKGYLEAIDAYAELLKPFMHLPQARRIQHCIDVAKARVSLSEEALTDAGPEAQNLEAGKKRKAETGLSLDVTSDQQKG